MTYKGRAFVYGDDIDTDVIIPARYLNTVDPQELAAHCMEDIDPEFVNKVKPGDIIVGGKNFGCGSSREHAPIAIRASGVSLVVAENFARIFYRNSFNTGFVLVELEDASTRFAMGDEIEVDLTAGRVRNLTQNKEYTFEPIPEFMLELVNDGGLIPHILKKQASA